MTNTNKGETTSAIGTQRWVETGSGPPVLLLHGIYAAAGRHEWDRLVPALANDRTVRVPDLLGFGTSDRPARQFDAGVVNAAVEALIDDVPDDATVVASSLTAAYALAVLDQRGWRGGCVLITPTGLGRSQSRAPSGTARALEAAWRRTPLGDVLSRALVSAPSLRWFLRNQAYANADLVTDEVIAAHREAADHPHAKYPLVAFVAGALARPVDAAAIARLAPTVLWGRGQAFSADADAERWENAGAAVRRLQSGLPQAEEPEVVAAAVLESKSRLV